MPKLLNHPWTIAAGGALLTVILAEVGPLHLFSGHVVLWVRESLTVLAQVVSAPLWVFLAGALAEASVIVLSAFALNHTRRKRWHMSFAGLHWRKSIDAHEVWPICSYCMVPLQPRVEPEQRRDRNGVPFQFTPEFPNVLYCAGCSRFSRLRRPWDEILKEARIFFGVGTSSSERIF
jgi:hypothetical protein